LFSIDKDYFNHLGKYDEKMDIWGGENIEISFRIWMCGGTLEVVPCSRVGHIFRKKSPYVWRPGKNVFKINTCRMAKVWMDEFAEVYFARAGKCEEDIGDLSERIKLRENLKCKSFKWYMENVATGKESPVDGISFGEVKKIE
jgi:polypeptide N-acetylgalactosaminyltransferase